MCDVQYGLARYQGLLAWCCELRSVCVCDDDDGGGGDDDGDDGDGGGGDGVGDDG